MRKILAVAIVTAMLTLSGNAIAATSVTSADAAHAAVARLRAQNDVLRERMGQMQLDLLITDVLAAPPAQRIAPAPRIVALPSAQVVAFRK